MSTFVNVVDPLAPGTIWAKANVLAMRWIRLIDVIFSNGVQMSGVNRHSEERRRSSDHGSLKIFHRVLPVPTVFHAPSSPVLYDNHSDHQIVPCRLEMSFSWLS